jgi:hypothetical protein
MSVPYFYTISIQARQTTIGVSPRVAWQAGIVDIVPGHTAKKIFEFVLAKVAAEYSIDDPLLLSFSLRPNEFSLETS